MKKLGPYNKIFQLTPPAIRKRFLAAFFLIGIVGVLEVFSLSALLTFFTVGLNSGGSSQLVALTDWMGVDGVSPPSTLLAVALGLFIAKAFFILIVGQYSYYTATAVKRYFQDRLFDRFLHSPFQFQADKRSAEWVRNVTIDCNALEGRFFMPLLVLLGEVIPALFICSALFLVNATAFLAAMGIFAVIGASIFLTTHRRLVRLGQAQQTADGHIVQLAQQAFHGLSELKIYNLKEWAQQRFQSFTNASRRAINEALFISLLPRFAFEIALYISLGLVFIFYTLNGTPLVQVAGEIMIFGAAAMRLLPSVSKVVSHLQALKHAKPAIVAVTNTLLAPVEPEWPLGRKDEHLLKFRSISLVGVGFTYTGQDVLSSLDIKIVAGDKLAVMGASGSGKSTLINLILGLLPPTKGQVMLNKLPLAKREAQWWTCIGYVPQEPFLMDANAITNIMLGNDGYTDEDVARAHELISRLDLPNSLMEKTNNIGEDGARLSGGQRQRIAIARALCRNPQVLILDEATSAMDLQTQERVIDVVSEYMKDRTVLMITHRAETLKYCNKVLTLPEGVLTYREHSHA